MKFSGWIYSVLLAGAAVLGGCNPNGNLMTQQNGQPPRLHEGSVIAPASQWRAGSAMMSDASNAIDGNLGTYAVSNNPRTGSITVDLSKPCSFNTIKIFHGSHEHAHARTVVLLTSIDGRRFVRRHSQAGQRRVTNMVLIRPVLARYIRLQVLEPGAEAWRIAEIDVR